MLLNSKSVPGMFTERLRSTRPCHIVKSNIMGGNMRFTVLLGINTMRNAITINAISKNGVYCLVPSFIWSPLRRKSSDSSINTTSHENSSNSPVDIIKKLLNKKFLIIDTDIMNIINPHATKSTGSFFLKFSLLRILLGRSQRMIT